MSREGGPTPQPGDLLRMSLPLADVSHAPPACAGPGSDLVRICSGGLPVQDICFTESDGLKYLLLVLESSVKQQQLEAIRPDFASLREAGASGGVRGVIVSVAGGAPLPQRDGCVLWFEVRPPAAANRRDMHSC